jgi:hypothetical protein
MRLIDLDAKFLKFIPIPEHGPQHYGWRHQDIGFQEADAIRFLCPKCFTYNRGEIGTHVIVCVRFGRTPDWVHPGPGRWVFEGTGLHDLTLNAPPGKSRSVLLTSGHCGDPRVPNNAPYHGFITQGDASIL